jgi:hypothetical protein
VPRVKLLQRERRFRDLQTELALSRDLLDRYERLVRAIETELETASMHTEPGAGVDPRWQHRLELLSELRAILLSDDSDPDFVPQKD